jgi:outer membrane protein, heavy metal efflux system
MKLLIFLILAGLGAPAAPDEVSLTEAELIRRLHDQNVQIRALRARFPELEAQARALSIPPAPSVAYNRESAAGTSEEFFLLEQVLPLSRRSTFLRRAGEAGVGAEEARVRQLVHELESDLRLAYCDLRLAEEKRAALSESSQRIAEVLRIVRERERAGESSSFDRIRVERELAEIQSELLELEVTRAEARNRIGSLVSSDGNMGDFRAADALTIPDTLPALPELLARALKARGDLTAFDGRQRLLELEREAARRLRYPEPVISAGVKKTSVAGIADSGPVISVTVPLPLVGRSKSEERVVVLAMERNVGERAALETVVTSGVRAAHAAAENRRKLFADYSRLVQTPGYELTRIAEIAYQEGEQRILEVLDAYRTVLRSELRALELKAAARKAVLQLERITGERIVP